MMDEFDFLSEVFTDYCSKHTLPLMSADDLLASGHALTDEQKEWLNKFIEVWEKLTAYDF